MTLYQSEENKQGMTRQKVDLSIVVPLYNEVDNVTLLHEKIVTACEAMHSSRDVTYEIIFVDDGSLDATADACKELSPLTLIRFRTNYGQTAAFDAGFKAANGRHVVTMDGDLQNDPADIEKLLDTLELGDYDIVSGWRKKRRDTVMKRFFSRGANILRKVLLKDTIRDSGCSLKVYKAETLEGLQLFGEMHRFIPALLEMDGWRVGEVAVTHHARHAGTTKYNWKRAVKGFVDMVFIWFWRSYGARPIHFFGGAGIALIIVGSTILTWMVYIKLFMGASLSDRIWPLMGVFLIMLGVQFFIFGLLADIMTKNYYKAHGRMNYAIRDVVVKK